MHALIVGPRGVGKSTLIRQVLQELDRPLFGYETKKEITLTDPVHGDPVYIYAAGAERRQTEENLLGYCKNEHASAMVDAFERYAPKLMQAVPHGSIIKLDEIGFMEAKSPAFSKAILHLLDGDVPIIAAVKDKDVPFLAQVRAHPNAKCFCITEENRDALCREVLLFMQKQLDEHR